MHNWSVTKPPFVSECSIFRKEALEGVGWKKKFHSEISAINFCPAFGGWDFFH